MPSKKFLPTPSTRRATADSRRPGPAGSDFYPRPPRGGRPWGKSNRKAKEYFYPRPPRGGRPGVGKHIRPTHPNFYPRPPRGGRPLQYAADIPPFCISTHALHEEGDIPGKGIKDDPSQFLPTPSTRRATAAWIGFSSACSISTHALHEEGDRRCCRCGG